MLAVNARCTTLERIRWTFALAPSRWRLCLYRKSGRVLEEINHGHQNQSAKNTSSAFSIHPADDLKLDAITGSRFIHLLPRILPSAPILSKNKHHAAADLFCCDLSHLTEHDIVNLWKRPTPK
jgi:hypothetical protein